MYSFVIGHTLSLGEHKFPDILSLYESRQGSFLQPGGSPVTMCVTETRVLALGIESNVRIDVYKTRKGFQATQSVLDLLGCYN